MTCSFLKQEIFCEKKQSDEVEVILSGAAPTKKNAGFTRGPYNPPLKGAILKMSAL